MNFGSDQHVLDADARRFESSWLFCSHACLLCRVLVWGVGNVAGIFYGKMGFDVVEVGSDQQDRI